MNSHHTATRVTAVLRGHNDLDTALVAPDQPYNRGGSIRTTIRYWIHTGSRGHQQLTTQAQDPATQNWNPPHPGQPMGAVFLVRYDDHHIGGIAIPTTLWPADWVAIWLTGIWDHLDADERAWIAYRLRAMAQRNAPAWTRWFNTIDRMRDRGPLPFEAWRSQPGNALLTRAEDYAALRRYLDIGGPDLRAEGWHKAAADPEADSRNR